MPKRVLESEKLGRLLEKVTDKIERRKVWVVNAKESVAGTQKGSKARERAQAKLAAHQESLAGLKEEATALKDAIKEAKQEEREAAKAQKLAA